MTSKTAANPYNRRFLIKGGLTLDYTCPQTPTLRPSALTARRLRFLHAVESRETIGWQAKAPAPQERRSLRAKVGRFRLSTRRFPPGHKLRHAVERVFADSGSVYETVQPHQAGFPAEPGQLPFGVLPRVALGVENRLALIQLATDVLQRLFVTVRFERLGCFGEPARQDVPYFIHQPAGKHGGRALVEPPVQLVAIGQQADLEGAVAAQRIAALAEDFAGRPVHEETDFQRPRDLWHVMRMNLARGFAIDAVEQAVQGARALSLAGRQTVAQFLVA